MVELARRAEDSIMPGERDSILKALQQIQVRKNILRKVEGLSRPRSLPPRKPPMARTGLDAAAKEKVVMILAAAAANGAVSPRSTFASW